MGNDCTYVPGTASEHKVKDEPTVVLFTDTAGGRVTYENDFTVGAYGVTLLFPHRREVVFLPWHRIVSITGTPINVQMKVG